MAFQFLPITTNFPGSAGNQGVPYPIIWNPVTKRAESDDPNYRGYNRSGVLNIPKGLAPLPVAASGSYNTTPAGVEAGTSALPSIFQAPQVVAGSSPVYPLNVPTGAGVSTIAVPKSGNVAAAAKTGFEDLLKLGETQSKVNAEVKAMFPQWFADQQATATAENAATKGVFTGEAQAKVNADVANFLTQANAANAKSIADVQRLTSRSALASDASGYSSARDRGRFATIADINARAGKDAAVAQIQGDQWLTQLQQQMAGAQAARGRLAFGDVALPANMQAQQSAAFANILGSLTQSELNDLLVGVVGQGGYVGDTFGQLQGLKLQDLTRMSGDAQAADLSALNWSNIIQKGQLQPSVERTSANNAQAATSNLYKTMLTRYGV